MKHFAFAFVMAATMTASFAQAQNDEMTAACGRLTQEMNIAQEQHRALEAKRETLKTLGELRMNNAEITNLDNMISEINEEMNKVCF